MKVWEKKISSLEKKLFLILQKSVLFCIIVFHLLKQEAYNIEKLYWKTNIEIFFKINIFCKIYGNIYIYFQVEKCQFPILFFHQETENEAKYHCIANGH